MFEPTTDLDLITEFDFLRMREVSIELFTTVILSIVDIFLLDHADIIFLIELILSV